MKINKKTMIGSVGLALMLSSGALFGADKLFGSDKESRGQFTSSDYKFVTDVSRSGMEEVQLGELAKQKAGSTGVREFGEKMITDHQKANDELKQIVQKKGALIPTSLSRSETSTLEHLQKFSGAEFDKAYISDMVRDHKKDVKEFERATKNLSDPELKAFAEKTLPTLQEHLRQAENLEAQLKGK
jgi:putative membrane protein